MSLRYEQYHSLKLTYLLLRDLLDSKHRPKTVQGLKERAIQCLRHFPHLRDSGKPIFSNDDITKD